jgi:hypothetical protein
VLPTAIVTRSSKLGPWVRSVKDYGAAGDAKFSSDGSIAAGTPNFTTTGANWTAASVGKAIWVAGAGAAGAVLSSTIVAVVSSTAVTLADTAGTTVSGAQYISGTDDTAAFQAAINAASAGAVYVDTASYLCGTLTVSSGLTISGANGAIILTTPGNSARILLKPGTNAPLFTNGGSAASAVTIKDLKLDGTAPFQTAASALINQGDLGSSTEVHWLIDRCTVQNSNGIGIYLGNNNRGSQVFRTWVYINGSYGIQCAGSDNQILNNLIGTNTDHGVYISGSAWDTMVVGNNIFGNRGGIVVQSVKTTMIGYNTIDGNNQHGVYAGSTTALTIFGNSFNGNGKSANNSYPSIQLASSAQDAAIIGNTFANTAANANLPSFDVFCDSTSFFRDAANTTLSSSVGGFSNATGPKSLLRGTVQIRRNAQAGNYQMVVGDNILACTGTQSVAQNITLPAANLSSSSACMEFTIVDEGNGAGTHNITISCGGSDTFIDGSTTKTISTNGGLRRLYSNGTKWVLTA